MVGPDPLWLLNGFVLTICLAETPLPQGGTRRRFCIKSPYGWGRVPPWGSGVSALFPGVTVPHPIPSCSITSRICSNHVDKLINFVFNIDLSVREART
jgi:hypothetical protein